MSRIKCPSCGNEAYREDKICPHCGSQLPALGGLFSGSATPAPVSPAAPESSRLVRCPDCGQEISKYAPACPHCGAPQIAVVPKMVRSGKGDWGFEWRSQAEIFGVPLIHVAFGRKNGKLQVAKGVIAIGQFALGIITFAQFGVGVLFGFGQFIFGATAVSQFAVAILFGLGQFATGYLAIGQFAIGWYALGQVAVGWLSCMPKHCSPEAKNFFLQLARRLALPF